MVELVVSILVMIVLTAVAVPSLMRSLRAYQLNQAAGQVSDMLRFTRFEAVRRNTQINFQVTQNGTSWMVWTDSFFAGNAGPIDPRDKQQTIAGFPRLLAAGTAPPPTAIRAALRGAPLTTLSGANNTVTFDARGAIRNGLGGQVSNAIYVFYVGNATDPDSGYRAVILLPSGSTQVWTAPAGGPWRQVS
jgi:type II secretory pathway pseudopilin PulG